MLKTQKVSSKMVQYNFIYIICIHKMGSILMRELKNLSYESISNNMFANDHTTLNNNSKYFEGKN